MSTMGPSSGDTSSVFRGKRSRLRQLEDTFLFVLYVMMSSSAQLRPNVWVTAAHLFADWIHFAGFILGADFNFGSITKAYGQVIVFLQFRTPYRYGYYMPDFVIVFAIFVFLTAMVSLITVLVMLSFHQRNFQHVWPIKLLLAVAALFKLFAVASISSLLSPVFCDPVKNTLIHFSTVPCNSPIVLPTLIAGLVATAILVPFLLANTMTNVSLRHSPNDLLACSITPYQFLSVVALLVFLLEGEYLGVVVHGPAWMAPIFLVTLVALEFVLIYTVPYHHESTTRLQSGSLMSLIWLAACALVSVASPPNYTLENRSLDYVMILGIAPAFWVGMRLARYRYETIHRFRQLVMLEVAAAARDAGPGHSPAALALAHMNGGDMGGHGAGGVSSGSACPVVRRATVHYDLPSHTEVHVRLARNPAIARALRSTATVEIISRLLIRSMAWDAAEAWLRAALDANSNNPTINLLYCNFVDAARECNAMAAPVEATTYETVKNLEPSFGVRFLLFCRFIDAEQKVATANVVSGTAKLDLLQYVEFQRNVTEARRYHAKCVDSIQQFWILFLSKKIRFQSFESAVRTIITNTKRADDFYKQLLSRYPKATHILRSYANFAKLVLNDQDLAATYNAQADAAKAREEDLLKSGAGVEQDASALVGAANMTTFNRNAVITIDDNGVVCEINGSVLKIFGYESKHDVIQRKINSLMPWPWRAYHDEYITRYKATGVKRVIGMRQTAFGLHAKGWSFPMELQIIELKGKQRLFAGLVTPVREDEKMALVLINRDGIIQLVNRQASTMFGYKPVEMVGNNITLLMTASFAAQHDAFLQRYLSSGVSRVIGTTGRAVVGKHKDGKSFPISLQVVEEVINGDIFFRGTIVDMRTLVAEVYMDPQGIIKNCNDAFLSLFGYDRMSIVGQNIKTIMPEPYRSFHDSFLDRYKKTKIPNIQRATEGRLLPALHRDGSLFTINLKVKKLDGGVSSADMLFQGTIVRIESTEQAAVDALEGKRIQVNASGIVAEWGDAAANLVGATSAQLTGRSIAAVFPPVPEAHQAHADIKELIERVISDPEQWFYGLMHRQDKTLTPVAVSGAEVNDSIVLYVDDLMAKEGLVFISESGSMVSVNDGVAFLFGFPVEELQNQSIRKLLPDFDVVEEDGDVTASTTTTATSADLPRQTVNGVHRDGSHFDVVVEYLRRTSDDGPILMARITHARVTHKVHADVLRNLRDNGHLGSTLSGLHPTTGTGGGTINRNVLGSMQLALSNVRSETRLQPGTDEYGLDPSSPYEIKITTTADTSSASIPAPISFRVPSAAMMVSAPPPPSSPEPMSATTAVDEPLVSSPPPAHPFGSPPDSPNIGAVRSLSPSLRIMDPRRRSQSAQSAFSGSARSSHISIPQLKAAMSSTTYNFGSTMPVSGAAGANAAGMSGLLAMGNGSGSRDDRGPASFNRSYSIMQSGNSDGSLNSDSEANSNRFTRDSKLILVWKNSKTNPLHGMLQRRLWVALFLLLGGTVCILVALAYLNIGSQIALVTPCFNQLALMGDTITAIELLPICRSTPDLLTACTRTNLTASVRTLSAQLAASTSQMIPISSNILNKGFAVPSNLSLVQYIDTDPSVASTVVMPDYFQAMSQFISAVNNVAQVAGDPTADRSWRFVTSNKDVFLTSTTMFSTQIATIVRATWYKYETRVLGILISAILFAVFLYLLVIWPKLRALNHERGKAMQLISQIPRNVIQYLAYQVYEMDEESEDFDESDEDGKSGVPAPPPVPEPESLPMRLVRRASFVRQAPGDGGAVLAPSSDPNAAAALMAAARRRKAAKAAKEQMMIKPTDYLAYAVFTLMYMTVVIPSFSVLLINALKGAPELGVIMDGFTTSLDMYTSLYPINGIALEVVRPGANWAASRAPAFETVITTAKSQLNAIDRAIAMYASPSPFVDLMRLPYATPTPAPQLASLVNLTSSTGLAFVLQDAFQAGSTLARVSLSPADAAANDQVRQALAHFVNDAPHQMLLGFYQLLQLQLSYFADVYAFYLGINQKLHIALMFQIVVVFFFLYRMQRSMREDIKQNCLLLLMVPPSVISKQPPLKTYLRRLCQDIRRQIGAIGMGEDPAAQTQSAQEGGDGQGVGATRP
ncbi:hypothetical protein H9P43_000122 [Blastocladiella emersonii ATCC 22665]|nr:hypothetical protein H9P43_000122 [Blastocladiella emersonii ATCC 22665]